MERYVDDGVCALDLNVVSQFDIKIGGRVVREKIGDSRTER